jgi:ribosomal protein S18 acetylase RimI-like enzyme
VAIRRATIEDVPLLGRVLGAAFDDDPVINWFVRQDERRAASIKLLFREVTRWAYLGHGETYVADDGAGVAVWRPPGFGEPPPIPQLDALWPEVTGTDERRERLNRLGELMDGKHPHEPHHFYLFAIGVAPGSQGGGVGSRLIREVLDRCDRERIPAYLENTKERNLAFYEPHGFRVMERIDLDSGGPSMWLMWREPQ